MGGQHGVGQFIAAAQIKDQICRHENVSAARFQVRLATVLQSQLLLKSAQPYSSAMLTGWAKVPEAAGPWEDVPPLNERKPSCFRDERLRRRWTADCAELHNLGVFRPVAQLISFLLSNQIRFWPARPTGMMEAFVTDLPAFSPRLIEKVPSLQPRFKIGLRHLNARVN